VSVNGGHNFRFDSLEISKTRTLVLVALPGNPWLVPGRTTHF
jgi:hypothetical protein